MLFTTTTQLAALALVLIAGWLLGLASSSGGRKWRDRFRSEEAAHKQYRSEVAADLKTREARLREVEVERDRYHSQLGTGAAVAGTGAAAAALHGHDTHERTSERRGISGWLGGGGSGSHDDLSRIRGIDPTTERALHDHGIRSYRAIETLSGDDARTIEAQLGLRPGTIDHEGWREQAADLRHDHDLRGRPNH